MAEREEWPKEKKVEDFGCKFNEGTVLMILLPQGKQHSSNINTSYHTRIPVGREIMVGGWPVNISGKQIFAQTCRISGRSNYST